MLHVDARLCTLTLVNRMAHAKTAQCTLTLLCGSRHPSQRQRGKNHCENREFRAPHHGCPESIYQPNQSVDSLHLVPFSPPLPDNRSNKPSRIVRLYVVPRIGVGFTPMYLVPSYSIGHLGRAWTLTCNSKIRCVIVFLSGVAISHWHMSQAEFPPILCSFGVWQIMCKPQCNLVSSDCWFVPRRTFSRIKNPSQEIIVCRFSGPFFYSASAFSRDVLRSVSTSRSMLLFKARTVTSSRSDARSVTTLKAGSRCAPNLNSTIRKPSFRCVAGTPKCNAPTATRTSISATPPSRARTATPICIAARMAPSVTSATTPMVGCFHSQHQ